MFKKGRALHSITRITVSSLRPGFAILDPEQIGRVSDDPRILGYICGVFFFYLEVAKRADSRLKLSDLLVFSTLQTVMSILFKDHRIGHRAGRRSWDALARNEPVWLQALESGMDAAVDMDTNQEGSDLESASFEEFARRITSIAYGIDPDLEVSD